MSEMQNESLTDKNENINNHSDNDNEEEKEELKELEEPNTLEEFKSWIKSNKTFPQNIPDAFLLRYLKVCDEDLKRAQDLLKTNLTLRMSQPNLFTNRDITLDEIQNAKDILQFCILPTLTKEGYKITVGGFLNTDVSRFDYLYCIKMVLMMFDCVFSDFDIGEEIAEGEIVIMDLKGLSFRHFLKVVGHLPTAIFYMRYLQEAAPIKLCQVNIINPSSIVDRMFSLMRPFMTKELLDVIQIHSKLETLHTRIPKELLPQELGGTADIDMIEIHKSWIEKLEQKQDYLKNDDNWRIAE